MPHKSYPVSRRSPTFPTRLQRVESPNRCISRCWLFFRRGHAGPVCGHSSQEKVGLQQAIVGNGASFKLKNLPTLRIPVLRRAGDDLAISSSPPPKSLLATTASVGWRRSN